MLNGKLNYTCAIEHSASIILWREKHLGRYPYPYSVSSYLTMMMCYYRISASIAQVISLFLLVPRDPRYPRRKPIQYVADFSAKPSRCDRIKRTKALRPRCAHSKRLGLPLLLLPPLRLRLLSFRGGALAAGTAPDFLLVPPLCSNHNT